METALTSSSASSVPRRQTSTTFSSSPTPPSPDSVSALRARTTARRNDGDCLIMSRGWVVVVAGKKEDEVDARGWVRKKDGESER